MNTLCWLLHAWAAWYNTWLLIKSTLKCVVLSFLFLAAVWNIYETEQQWVLTLPAGERVRLPAGLLRVGVLRRCLSRIGEAARRRGGERGRRPLGDTGLQQCQTPFKHCLLT